jgi:hypothetical protein
MKLKNQNSEEDGAAGVEGSTAVMERRRLTEMRESFD